MSPYFEMLCYLLKKDNWKEPTKEKYHIYLEAYKNQKHKNNEEDL